MRYVVILLVLLSLPAFITMLKQSPQNRAWAFTAIGFMLYLGAQLRVEAAIIAWPFWTGTQIGLDISPVDSLAIALIVTRQRQKQRLPYWPLLGLFVGTIWLSLIPSLVPFATFFICWQSLRIVLLFVAIGGEMHNPKLRQALMTGMALGILLQAGYVITQKLHGAVQPTGTMWHQNTLGMMIEIGLLPLIGSLLGGDRRKVIIIGIMAAVLIVASLGSRGAMVMASVGAISLLIVSLIRSRTPVKITVVSFMALGIVLAIPLGVIALKDRFGKVTVTVDDEQRPRYEAAARAMANDYPFGVGANLYVTTASTQHYADRAGVAWNRANRSAPVHNGYLLARAETGWLGELSLYLLLVVPFIGALRAAFRDRRFINGEALLASAAALGVNFAHNFYEFATLTYFVQSLLIVNVAIIASCLRAAAANRPRRPERPAAAQREQVDVRSRAQSAT